MMNVKEILRLIPDVSDDQKKLITKAYIFAEKAHKEEKRYSGEPYFVHVFEVTKTLAHIEQISKDDYNHRLESIDAGKRSPLYREYVRIGRESLAAGKDVHYYLSEKDGETLTVEDPSEDPEPDVPIQDSEADKVPLSLVTVPETTF